MKKIMRVFLFFCLYLIGIILHAESIIYDDIGRFQSTSKNVGSKQTYQYRDNGQLSQIKSEGTQTIANKPVAQFTLPNTSSLTVGDDYNFNASSSTNPAGTSNELRYRWDFDGDGEWDTNFSTQAQTAHTYQQVGDYNVSLQVKNTQGASHTTAKLLRVFSKDKGTPPTAVISSSIGNATSGNIGKVGATIFLSANNSTDPDNDIDSYRWDFGDGSTIQKFATQSKRYAKAGRYTIALTVIDSRGQSHTVQKVITIQSADVPVPPTLSTTKSSYSVTQGQLLDIPLSFSDDGSLSQLRFTTSGATGSYIEEQLNKAGEMHFRWRPDASQQGTFNVALKITDDDNLSATRNITVTVAKDNTLGAVQRFVKKISSVAIGTSAKSLDISGNYVYVVGESRSKGLTTINIQNPLTPVISNVDDTGKEPYDIDVEAGKVYIPRFDKEIYIYSATSSPTLLGKTNLRSGGNFVNATADGNIILATNTDGVLWVIDASNPSSPTKKSTIAGLSEYYHIQRHPTEKKFYAVANNKIAIYDYSSLTAPRFISYVNGTDHVNAFHVSKNDKKLYVGYSFSGNGFVKAFDISNASAPSFIAQADMDISQTESITADEQGNVFIYSGSNSSLRCNYTLNYARLSGNTLTKETVICATDTLKKMIAQNGYLYVAQDDNGLVIYQYGEKANQRPIAINQHITTRWDQPVTITLSGTDGDNDTLTYNYIIDSVNRGQVTERNYPTVKYVPPIGYEGEDVFLFTANDGIETSLSGSIAITVIAPPRAPVLDAISNKTVQENKLLSFDVVANDPDFQDKVTLTASNLPTGASFEAGKFSWSPDYGAYATSPYTVTFTATDKTGLTDSKQVTLTVNRQNKLPTISQFTALPTTGTAPLITTLAVNAIDPDADGKIASVQFDYGDGTTGNSTSHTYTTAGTYKAIATVTDNVGGTATATVDIQVNAVKAGIFSVEKTNITANEADGFVTINVLRTGGSDGAATLNYQVNAGTAIANKDYITPSGTLNFATGEVSVPIRIALVNDTQFENDKTFSVVLSSVSAGSLGIQKATNLVLKSDDIQQLGTAQFTQDNYDVTEQAGTVQIALERLTGTDGVLTLGYSVAAGTATAGEDFTAATGTISFAEGELSKTLPIVLKEDALHENDETILLTLSGSAVGERKTAQLTLRDNDLAQAGAFSFTAGTALNVQEGVGRQNIEIQRTDGSDGDVSVRVLSIADTAIAGEDFVIVNDVLTFAKGETSKTTSVLILDDQVVEDTKQFKLALSSATGGASIKQGQLIITVEDNDVADQDEDGVKDDIDNCPTVANADQANMDEDSEGDVCDSDRDGDDVANDQDAFPDDKTEWLDTDKDGIGNNTDTDDDGDGIVDEQDDFPLDPEITAKVTVNATRLPLKDKFVFDASESTGEGLKYSWDVNGDGIFEVENTANPVFSHLYSKIGDYSLSLKVEDAKNRTKIINKQVTVLPLTQDSISGYSSNIVLASFGNFLAVGQFSKNKVEIYQLLDDGSLLKEAELSADNQDENFGISLSLYGDLIAVGATNAEVDGVKSGAVYLYKRINEKWERINKLAPSNPTHNQYFGRVSLSNEFLAVGAHGTGANGSVYLFNKSLDWQEEVKIVDPMAGLGYWFGNSLLLSANELFVSNSDGNFTGSVHVFERNISGHWEEKQRLSLSNQRKPYDNFGFGLSYASGTLAISAYGRDSSDELENVGALYLYKKSQNKWKLDQELLPDFLKEDDRFGYKAIIRDQFLFVGSSGSDNGDTKDAGLVSVFSLSNAGSWEYFTDLEHSTIKNTELLGEQVVVVANTVFVAGRNSSEIRRFDLGTFETDKDWDNVVDTFIADNVPYDNCPSVTNPDQWDLDADGKGNVCDSDRDGDDIENQQDAFPDDKAEWLDTDSDGIGNNKDIDDDGDKLPDEWETANGLDPLDATDATKDSDGDGVANLEEFSATTDPQDALSFPTQQLISIKCPEKGAAGTDIDCEVWYDTNNKNPNTKGVSVNVHIDSNRLENLRINNTFKNDLISQDIQAALDTNDLDNDAVTDSYFATIWEAVSNTWPGQSDPIMLFVMTLRLADDLTIDDSSTINISGEAANEIGYSLVTTSATISVTNAFTWDIDNDGEVKPLTDGLLVLRYLFSFRGNTLIEDAVDPNASRNTAKAIETYLQQGVDSGAIDIDGNRAVEPLTDGLLLLRYLFNFRNDTLIGNAVGTDASRNTSEQISLFIEKGID